VIEGLRVNLSDVRSAPRPRGKTRRCWWGSSPKGGLAAAWPQQAVALVRERWVWWLSELLLSTGVLEDLRMGEDDE
jgi:hypothetical protein